MENEEKKNEERDDLFLKTRSVLICGEVSEQLSEKIAKQLLMLEKASDEPIYVYIDSPGGDVNAGYAIFDMLRFVNCEVYTIGMGLVASAASLILLSVPKDHRFALPHSSYLIHQPSSKMRGVASDIQIHARQLEKLKAEINEVISEQTGTPLEKVAADTERDCWLDSREALSYGLVSRIIERRADI